MCLLISWMVYIGGVSYYSVVGLNMDRAFLVTFPMRASSRSKKNLLYGIFFCWILPLILAVPYIFDKAVADCGKTCHACWVGVNDDGSVHPLTLFHVIIGCILPMIIIFCCWSLIFSALRKPIPGTAISETRQQENRLEVTNMMKEVNFLFQAGYNGDWCSQHSFHYLHSSSHIHVHQLHHRAPQDHHVDGHLLHQCLQQQSPQPSSLHVLDWSKEGFCSQVFLLQNC